MHFGFRRALVLDAESRIIKPLNLRMLLGDSKHKVGGLSGFWAAPSYWYSTKRLLHLHTWFTFTFHVYV